jgi:hypothetical protein
MYEPTTFVEPLGYQPVEFLDIDIPLVSEWRPLSGGGGDAGTARPTGGVNSEHVM